MASPILRPKYTEGQVLSAADLEAQVAYARVDSAIHERTEHIWGIASGLRLDLRDPKQGANNVTYGRAFVGTGVAVDASGRRIVVGEEREITPRDFVNAGVWSSGDPKDTRYPVYLVAIEEAVVSRAAGRCGVDAATRVTEGFQIEIGRPGSERAVNAPTTAVPVASGPATGRKVLLGHVTWDQKVVAGGAFTSAGADTTVRYAGVRASSVIPHAGRLVLATGDGDPRFVVELMQDDQGKAVLRFGRQTGTGPVSDLFVVDDKGDVTVAGTIKSAIPLQVPVTISGTVPHGLKLPLPPQVTEDMIRDGRVSVEYMVSLRLQKTPKRFIVGNLRPVQDALPVVIECAVDPDPLLRRVTCRVKWTSTVNNANTRTEGGLVDYVLVATPTPKGTP